MHVTAKADYAMRAIVEISVAPDGRAKAEQIASAQDIPLGFLRGILTDLRRSGLIVSQRSANGGFRLARPASEITIAEVVRSVEGPLALVRGLRPTELDYPGATAPLRDLAAARTPMTTAQKKPPAKPAPRAMAQPPASAARRAQTRVAHPVPAPRRKRAAATTATVQ